MRSFLTEYAMYLQYLECQGHFDDEKYIHRNIQNVFTQFSVNQSKISNDESMMEVMASLTAKSLVEYFTPWCWQSDKLFTKFIAELHLLSNSFEFSSMLDDMIRDHMIRDHLVCGINDDKIQQRLLIEPKLTLAKATQLAQASELAKQDVAEINKESHGGAVPSHPANKLSSSSMIL